MNPTWYEIEQLIKDGAKTIPVKLVKRLLKDWNRDGDAHQKLIDKLEETIRRYG